MGTDDGAPAHVHRRGYPRFQRQLLLAGRHQARRFAHPQVLAQMKSIILIFAGMAIYGDIVSTQTAIGYATAIVGFAFYNWAKIKAKEEDDALAVKSGDEGADPEKAPLLDNNQPERIPTRAGLVRGKRSTVGRLTRGESRATAYASREASGASPAKASVSFGGDERRRSFRSRRLREGFDRVNVRSKGNADRHGQYSIIVRLDVFIGNFRRTPVGASPAGSNVGGWRRIASTADSSDTRVCGNRSLVRRCLVDFELLRKRCELAPDAESDARPDGPRRRARMSNFGGKGASLVLDIAQSEKGTIPPYNDELVRSVVDESQEHHRRS